MREFGLQDSELFPLMTEQGHEMLRGLREHPHAPIYNWRTGERLTQQGLDNVRAYAKTVKTGPASWRSGELPPWVVPFVENCRAKVPFYRERSNWPPTSDFFSIPLTRREDIRQSPGGFISDDLPLDDLIVYTTSGTSGTLLKIPATPELPSRYLPLMEQALARVGVRLEGGSRMSIVHVCAQHKTVVLCSLSSYLGGAGFAKINLDPADWKNPDDAVRFLDDCKPELYTGDPFSLWRLSQLPLKHKPKAIVSSATALSAGLRAKLASHFQCPVIDMFSMNESGPIGFSTIDGVHEILQSKLFVEILDEKGAACLPGVTGQLVLTGGLNPYLPLIRYATGDFAALDFASTGVPRLTNLHGRQPVAFRGSTGEWFNSVDIASALITLPLPRLSLHQNADGTLKLLASGDESDVAAAEALIRDLLGRDLSIVVEPEAGETVTGKPVSFSSDLWKRGTEDGSPSE